jgi:predicted permease
VLNQLLQLWRRLLFYLRRDQFDRDLAEEMELHLEMKVKENLKAGMKVADARAAAQRQFGNQTLLQEVSREMWGVKSIETLFRDLRYGVRMLLKSKVFTTVAVLSLALGIGANTAIFSLINAVLMKRLPVQDPEQLVLLTIADHGISGASFSYPLYEQFRDRTHSFSGIIASGGIGRLRVDLNESGAVGQIEFVQAENVSGNFFSVLGINTIRGRALTAEDDRAGNPHSVAVISYGFWQRRFGLDPAVVGKNIILKDVPFTIIGVAPPGFSGFEVGRSSDLWLPLQMMPQIFPRSDILNRRNTWWLRLMGRRRPDTTMAQARAELDLIFQSMLAEIAGSGVGSRWTSTERRNFLERNIELQSGSTGWTALRKQFEQPLLILMMVVGLVLAVACINVANLLLARAATRQKEITMRLALGAGRLRLVRQLLTESVLLAIIGGALGLLFAQWGARLLLTYLPGRGNLALNLHPDLRVFGFTLAVSVLTGFLFGLAPALRLTQLDLVSMLKDRADHSGRGKSRFSLNKILVVTQVALSLVLLVGAGLFMRSLQKLKGLDSGFNRENVILFSLDPDYDAERRANLYQQLLSRLEALPGVRSASLSSHGLLLNDNWNEKVAVEGYMPRPDEDLLCYGQVVAPKFFETMGIPILLGRDIGPQDARQIGNDAHQNPTHVALINQTMARYFFPNESPIGKRFTIDRPDEPIEIIGVVKDAKYETLREGPRRIFYLSFFQGSPKLTTTFEVRTVGPPASLAETIKRTMQELDPQVPVLRLRTMNDVVDDSLTRERFVARLSGFFSLFALLLAAIGLYGILSYVVIRRANEIGVRMALGARAPDVIRMVFRESMLLVVVGIAIGLGAALGATRYISNLLYGLAPTDPATISLAVLVMLIVASLASYLPARRASHVDPMVALRNE